MIGTKLGHFTITAHLGSGGMGDVYQATDSKLGRSVAIKLLPEAFVHDVERAARFEREARVLASLNHPNIAAIYGIEQSDDRKFLVMELAPGETLAERLKRGPIPVNEGLGIAKQIAEALEAAHDKGVIHRDLKPANIKVTPTGQVKVLDFGLARAFAGDVVDASPSDSPTLSQAATEAGMFLALTVMVDFIRLGSTLAGAPNAVAIWFSMTAMTLIGVVYFPIHAQRSGFETYKHVFILLALQLAVSGVIIATGTGIDRVTGVSNIFQTDSPNANHA